jgi:hypothetical protein
VSGRGRGSRAAASSSGSRLLSSACLGVPSHFLSKVRMCNVRGWVSSRVSNWVCNSRVGKRSLCEESVSILSHKVWDPSHMNMCVWGSGVVSKAVRAAWTNYPPHLPFSWYAHHEGGEVLRIIERFSDINDTVQVRASFYPF